MKPAIKEQLLDYRLLRHHAREKPHQSHHVMLTQEGRECTVSLKEEKGMPAGRGTSERWITWSVLVNHEAIHWIIKFMHCCLDKETQKPLYRQFKNLGHLPLFTCSWPFWTYNNNKKKETITSDKVTKPVHHFHQLVKMSSSILVFILWHNSDLGKQEKIFIPQR